MITLKDLISRYSELEGKKLLLVRHALRSDRSICLEHDVKASDLERYSNLTAQQKLQSLRMDMGLLEVFSSEQWNDVYSDAKVILVFSSTGKRSAEFLGAFEIHGRLSYEKWTKKYRDYLGAAPEFLQLFDEGIKSHVVRLGYSASPARGKYFYEMSPVSGDINNDLRRRLVVNWQSPIKWVQHELNKAVLEIRPPGFVREWNGYYDFTLSFGELRELVAAESGNPEWKSHLSGVSGVYVILDPATGRLYVGSAYGEGGIWSRWSGYAKTSHNNNKELVAHFSQEPKSFEKFQISILRVMDKAAKKADVIKEESLIKEKLGSRTFGFNAN